MTEKYTADSVVRVPWPRWARVDEHRHQRIWHFEVSAYLPEGELWRFREDGIDAVVTRGATPTLLVVTTVTADNPMSDRVFFDAAVRMFKLIEARFGRIRTIEDVDRDHWRGLRGEGALADVSGLEADWLACDADGHVALFSTAGSGYAPPEFLKDIEAHDTAIETIESLPASTRAAFFPELKPHLKNSWRLAAERGLFAFDSDPSGGPYKLVAAPVEPAHLSDFPEHIASLIERIRFRTIRFADHKLLTNAQIEDHLRVATH